MCAPAAVPIAFGVAQAGIGAVGAVGKYQQGQAQAAATNASNQASYRARLQSFQAQEAFKKQSFQNKKNVYNQQLAANKSAAQRAYEDEQTKLNEIYRAAAFQNQGALSQLLSKQGAAYSTGQSGRSIDRLENNLSSMYGRNLAVRDASLRSALSAYTRNTGEIRRANRNQDIQAFNKLGLQQPAGIAPPEPVKVSGPSPLGLVTDLGQAALSGYSTFNTLNRQRLGYDANDTNN